MEYYPIDCEFTEISSNKRGNVYVCQSKKSSSTYYISENGEFSLNGEHKYGKTNKDVSEVRINFSSFPRGIANIFPNLKYLQIWNNKLITIKRNDLKEIPQLVRLDLSGHSIEYLPADLFADNKELEMISFQSYSIQVIEPNILNGLSKLKYADFSGNPFIDRKFDSIFDKGNVTLQELKDLIRDNFLNLNPKIKEKFKDILTEAKCKQIDLMLKVCNDANQQNHDDGMLKDLKTIISNEKFKDFTVRVNDEEFKVHKFLLGARSPVFAQMIENNIDAEELNLVDIPTEIFREILNFMYTNELPTLDEINYIHLFTAAGRLQINKLKNFAAEILSDRISNENALEILILANKYENGNLRQKAFEQIKKMLPETKIDDSLAMDTDILKEILEMKKKKDEMMKAMESKINARSAMK